MSYYPSEEKLARAKVAVANYANLSVSSPGLAEVKLVAMGRQEGIKDEKLVEFVYNGLGGKPQLEGGEAKEAESKAKEAKERAAKKEDKVAVKRNKIAVK